MSEVVIYQCPGCGSEVEVTLTTEPQILPCPHCHNEFEVSAVQVDNDRLDTSHIRKIASERRATYRARSYAIIAAGVCLVAAIQLISMTIAHVRLRGWTMQPVGYVLFALLACLATVYFVRRAIELHRQAVNSRLPAAHIEE